MEFVKPASEIVKEEKISMVDVPKFVQNIVKNKVPVLKLTGGSRVRYDQDPMRTTDNLPENFKSCMYQFQKEGVNFGAQKFGRILLGDEMGVGKTIQAIAISYLYKHDWPILVITPASLKFQWRDEILKWIPTVQFSQIQLFEKGNDEFNKDSLIFIMSYQLAAKRHSELEKFHFRFVIADEAHYLKSRDSQRSKNLLPILEQSKRVILMSGTPVLNKPIEIFNLIRALRPDVCPKFKDFANRYCDPQLNRYGCDYSGASCTLELHYLLSQCFMVRRLKKDVLDQLPDKRRQQVQIQTDSKVLKQLAKAFSGKQKADLVEQLSKEPDEETTFSDLQKQIEQSKEGQGGNSFMELYKLTGMCKIEGVCDFVDNLVDNGAKFLVFAHHQCMIDALEAYCKKKSFGYIRIDGRVPSEKRHEYVKQFQTKSSVRLAILSIMAASQGLTLTAASCVVFAELTWTPSIMMQAEDRAHRIGQKNSVNIYYLHAKNTVDDVIFGILQKKSLITTGVTDGQKENLGLKNKKYDEIDYEELGADGTTTIKADLEAKHTIKKIDYSLIATPQKQSIVEQFFENRQKAKNNGQDTIMEQEEEDILNSSDQEAINDDTRLSEQSQDYNFKFNKKAPVKQYPSNVTTINVEEEISSNNTNSLFNGFSESRNAIECLQQDEEISNDFHQVAQIPKISKKRVKLDNSTNASSLINLKPAKHLSNKQSGCKKVKDDAFKDLISGLQGDSALTAKGHKKNSKKRSKNQLTKTD